MSVQIIIEYLNNTINQHDLSDIYKTLYPTIAEHIILSRACETCTEINYMLNSKTNINKFQF